MSGQREVHYKTISRSPDVSTHVAVARSEFNKEVVDSLCEAFYQELEKQAYPTIHVVEACVPGALELPYALSQLANAKFKGSSPDVLVALGCVIKGETFHFDIVSETSAAGVQQVSLTTGLPAVNGILTCYTADQAKERAQRNAKGYAEAALWMADMFTGGGKLGW